MFRKIHLFLILIFVYLILIPQTIHAQQRIRACNNPVVQTTPCVSVASCSTSPEDIGLIYNDTPAARMVIDVGNNAESGVTSWRVEFLCGVLGGAVGGRQVVNIPLGSEPGSTNIGFNVNNTRGCEFDPNNNSLGVKVKAIIGGQERDFCDASYTVINRDHLCRLAIEPNRDIKIGLVGNNATPLRVRAENLSANGNYALFFNNTPIGVDLLNLNTGGYRVNNVSFPINIPINLVSIGPHNISLRTRNNKPPPAALIPVVPIPFLVGGSIVDLPGYFNGPACRIDFTIGDDRNPGSVISSSNTAGGVTPVSSIPATSADKSICDGDPTQIKTAIGCIHTKPVDFIKDTLKFAIGIAGGIAFLLMIYGVFQMLTSAGNPDSLKSGQTILTNAIIGLLFIIFSTLLLKIIGVDILGIGDYFKI